MYILGPVAVKSGCSGKRSFSYWRHPSFFFVGNLGTCGFEGFKPLLNSGLEGSRIRQEVDVTIYVLLGRLGCIPFMKHGNSSLGLAVMNLRSRSG